MMYRFQVIASLLAVLTMTTQVPASAKAPDLRATQISVREGCGDSSYQSQGSHQGYTFDMSSGAQYTGLAGLNRPPYGGWTAPAITNFKFVEFTLQSPHDDPRSNFSIVIQDSTNGYYHVSGGLSGTINGKHFTSAYFDSLNSGWVPAPPATNAICKIAIVYHGGNNALTETMTETNLTIGYGDKHNPTKYQCKDDSYIVPSTASGFDTHFNYEP